MGTFFDLDKFCKLFLIYFIEDKNVWWKNQNLI